MLVTLVGVPLVNATEDAVAVTNSPTLPALALLFVVVPTMPEVWDGVMVLLAASVVKLPAFGVVFPIDGGAARVLATNAVVAICVVFVPVEAVGAAGVPVKVGDASSA